jgi:hypothetical protein
MSKQVNSQVQSDTAGEYRYWAFISYSHQDEQWASWLHSALESYRVPRKLVGRASPLGPLPRRLFPVFKDRDELPGASDLNQKIQEALKASRCIIVICSPQSAASRWVNEEIKRFKQLGREGRVLCLIVGGEPNATARSAASDVECFPEAIRYRVDADGELTGERAEPIAADARKGKDGRTNAKLKLIAGILGVGFDELRQRERRRALRRRSQIWAGAVGALILALSVYIALADKGLDIPGGEALRALLDRRELSVFRPVRNEQEIGVAADRARRALIERLVRESAEGKWVGESPARQDRPKIALSAWVASQAITAVYRAPDATDEQLRAVSKTLDVVFAPGFPVEKKGIKYGWMPTRASYTQAEPALWTVLAAAAALGREGFLSDAERKAYEQRLAYAQETSVAYYPLEDGGWNMFPNQRDPAQHSVYTSALALLALLETRAADQPWQGSRARRDDLLNACAEWLLSQYDHRSEPPGWHAMAGREGPISDGLTLQIYSELLRAEREAGFQLLPVISEAITRHLASLAGRPLDFPRVTAPFVVTFTNYSGEQRDEIQTLDFPWHSWAIECCVRWLNRADQTGTSAEDRVRVRRALGHLVVDIGEQGFADAASDKEATFVAAELLYCLSIIPRTSGDENKS